MDKILCLLGTIIANLSKNQVKELEKEADNL